MRAASLVLPALLLVLVQTPASSNAAPQAPRTGMIVGQVVDQAGSPVTEAIVQLALPALPEGSPTSPNSRVMADSEGRFFFTELPAGDYYIEATKPGYVRGSYGQRRPWGDDRRVTLRDGERRADVQLRVWKYAVIGGTVVDEAGEPVVGVAVRALPKTVVAGRTQFGNREVLAELVPAATTDDRGMFRLAQMSAGTYVVVAPSMQATVPARFLEGQLDTTVRNELFRAGVQEISPLGAPRTLQIGDFALLTLHRVLIPPPPDSSGRMQVYRTTYYPAAMTAAAATPIALRAGEERTDLTITLRPVPAVRVSGRLVTPDGSVPPPITIRMVGESMADVVTSTRPDIGFETVTGMSDAGGRFMLIGVPPGGYVLKHSNPFLTATVRAGSPAYWISQPVAVGNEDITELAVELRPALRVEGRMVFRSASNAQPTRIVGVGFEPPTGEPGQFFAEIDRESFSFSTVAAGGQYIVRAVESGGWFVQSVTLDGKDITDRVFDLQADATSFVITYTDRPSKVSGAVTDARGAASANATVLVFPVDPQRWSGYGTSPRTLKSVSTTESGVYTFAHLPPGEYYVIAVPTGSADGWQDPERLETFASQSTRLSVASGDTLKTIDLRLRDIQ